MKPHKIALPAIILYYTPGILAYIPIPMNPQLVDIIVTGMYGLQYCGLFLAGTLGYRVFEKRPEDTAYNRFWLMLMPLVLMLTALQYFGSMLYALLGYDWEPQSGYSIFDSIIIGLAFGIATILALRERKNHSPMTKEDENFML